ncbi:MAG: universal stress protein [Chitinophagaceae bacterium]|nr:universal stress protein [Chitinophagaceae bacterium]
MKKILVPTDFSPNADKALDYAVRLACYTNAKIILVHACDLPGHSFSDNVALKESFNRKLILESKEQLQMRKKSIETSERVSVQTAVYEGSVIDSVAEAAVKSKADLIVMGTLGSAAASEKIFGSKTAGLIGKTDIPVLVIPLLSEWEVPRNILLALNKPEEGTGDVIRPVVFLSKLFNAQLHFVHIANPGRAHPARTSTMDQLGNEYASRLQQAYDWNLISFSKLYGHGFEKIMEKYIQENQIHIVAMITHKRPLLKSIFHRSMTKKCHTILPFRCLC